MTETNYVSLRCYLQPLAVAGGAAAIQRSMASVVREAEVWNGQQGQPDQELPGGPFDLDDLNQTCPASRRETSTYLQRHSFRESLLTWASRLRCASRINLRGKLSQPRGAALVWHPVKQTGRARPAIANLTVTRRQLVSRNLLCWRREVGQGQASYFSGK
jgi:hypothetical protein